MLNKKIKAFTLAEMLVTLALTSMMVGFAYLGYNQLGRILKHQEEQSYFITQFNELQKRLLKMSHQQGKLFRLSENEFLFRGDSITCDIKFGDEKILLSRSNRTDTFKLKAQNVTVVNETLNAGTSALLINSFRAELRFQKQKFWLEMTKDYDSVTKLSAEMEEGR